MRKCWLRGAGAMLLAVLVACGGEASPKTPSPPTNVVSKAGPGYVTVTWEDKSDNETGFIIYRTPASDTTLTTQQSPKVGEVGPDTTTFIDTNVDIEISYSYEVTANSEAGESGS